MKVFEKRVACVSRVQDGRAGRNVVAEVIELLTGADGHQDCGGAFLSGEFGKVNCVVAWVDVLTELQVTGGDRAAAQGPVPSGRYTASAGKRDPVLRCCEQSRMGAATRAAGIAFADERMGPHVRLPCRNRVPMHSLGRESVQMASSLWSSGMVTNCSTPSVRKRRSISRICSERGRAGGLFPVVTR